MISDDSISDDESEWEYDDEYWSGNDLKEGMIGMELLYLNIYKSI